MSVCAHRKWAAQKHYFNAQHAEVSQKSCKQSILKTGREIFAILCVSCSHEAQGVQKHETRIRLCMQEMHSYHTNSCSVAVFVSTSDEIRRFVSSGPIKFLFFSFCAALIGPCTRPTLLYRATISKYTRPILSNVYG